MTIRISVRMHLLTSLNFRVSDMCLRLFNFDNLNFIICIIFSLYLCFLLFPLLLKNDVGCFTAHVMAKLFAIILSESNRTC